MISVHINKKINQSVAYERNQIWPLPGTFYLITPRDSFICYQREGEKEEREREKGVNTA